MSSPVHTQKLSRLKPVIIDAAIVIGISVALLVLAEALLAVFFPQNLLGTRIAGEHFSVRDDALGLRYIPGARWQFRHPEYTAEYAINKGGFRDEKAHPIPKPADSVRVLLVGDSFTFGQGVDYAHSWPVILERRLADLGHTHIDLVKAGMQGLDTRSELILMQRLLETYQYDVIVVGFLINDLYTNTLDGIGERDAAAPIKDGGQSLSELDRESADSWTERAKRIFMRNDRSWSFHFLTFAKRLVIASSVVYCKLYFISERGDFLTLPLNPEVKHKRHITARLFAKMADNSQTVGKKLIVLSIPQQAQVLCSEKPANRPSIDVTLYDRYFSDLATRHGFTWITSLDAFNHAENADDKLFYRLDGHLTPAGNQIVAEVFLKKIIPLIN